MKVTIVKNKITKDLPDGGTLEVQFDTYLEKDKTGKPETVSAAIAATYKIAKKMGIPETAVEVVTTEKGEGEPTNE